MENNITAEKFWRQSDTDDPVKNMIEFTKLKCQEQLQAILENVKIKIEWEGTPGLTPYETVVDKDSIINAYDLNNIK
jgi:hypothetical protein